MSWVDNLLSAAKALFTKQYATELKKQHLTKLDCRDFDQTFDALVRKLDTGSARRQSEASSDGPVELTPPSSTASQNGEEALDAPPPVPGYKKPITLQKWKESAIDDTTSTDATPVPTPDVPRPSTPAGASHLLTGKAGPGKASRRARKAQGLATSAPASSGDEASGKRSIKSKSNVKSKRRWDADGFAVDGDDDTVLDYSAQGGDAGDSERNVEEVNANDMGERTGKGQFVLKDLDDEVDAILAASSKKQASVEESTGESGGLFGTASSKITGMFRNVVGGKTLSKEDLKQPLLQMENFLVEKNVAREAAVRLCQSVETDLLNQKTGSFASIDKTIRESMGKALTRILTPTSSFDLLSTLR